MLLHSHTLSLREILIWGGRQGLKCGAIPLAHGTNGVNKMRSCFRPFSDCVGRLGPSLIPPAPICAIATLICLANGLAIKGQLSPAIATGGAPPVASKRYDALTTPTGRSDAACAVVKPPSATYARGRTQRTPFGISHGKRKCCGTLCRSQTLSSTASAFDGVR